MTYENVLILRIALETGMRVGDIVQLKASNLTGRTLNYIAEKTGKPDKKVLSKSLTNMLKKELRSNSSDEYFFKHRLDKTKHRQRQTVWKNLKQACKRSGLQANITPHSTRKTYGVEVFNDKGLQSAQKALQHDNVNTTMIYAFADKLLDNNSGNKFDFDKLADRIADKVIERIKNEL